MRHLALILALTLSACAPAHFQVSPPPDPTPTPSPTPSPAASPARGFPLGLYWVGLQWQDAYEAAAHQAVNDWNDAAGKTLFKWDASGTVALMQSKTKPILNGSLADGITIPTADGAFIALNADIPPDACYAVVAHELGHALGLSHSPIPGDLMFATVKPGTRMTPNDRQRARALAEQDTPL